jgi:hypothetical protein
MNPKIKAKIDPNSLEPSWFKVRTISPFNDEDKDKLRAWGAILHYENGALAMLTILPTRLDELAQLESVVEIL